MEAQLTYSYSPPPGGFTAVCMVTGMPRRVPTHPDTGHFPHPPRLPVPLWASGNHLPAFRPYSRPSLCWTPVNGTTCRALCVCFSGSRPRFEILPYVTHLGTPCLSAASGPPPRGYRRPFPALCGWTRRLPLVWGCHNDSCSLFPFLSGPHLGMWNSWFFMVSVCLTW